MLGEKTVLHYVLRNYCDVNARSRNWIRNIQVFLQHDAEREAQFKAELDAAIEKHTLSAAEYEELTGEDFDTHEDLVAALEELRDEIFDGHEP